VNGMRNREKLRKLNKRKNRNVVPTFCLIKELTIWQKF